MSANDNLPFQSVNTLHATGIFDPSLAITKLQLPDGRVVSLSTEMLDVVRLTPALTPSSSADDGLVIPLVEESLAVTRRTVETGKLRLHKTTQEFQAELDEPLAVRTYDVQRVVIGQPVEVDPEIRTEGDTTIYPVVEEQLVLTKVLILREEVRVTRRDTERRDTQSVTLRREHLQVDREDVT